MCSYAPGVLFAESYSKGGVMTLDLEKIGNFVRHKFCQKLVSCIFPKVFELVAKFYRNVCHYVKLCTWVFLYELI